MAVEMRYTEYLQQGWTVVKTNPVPSVVAGAVVGLPGVGMALAGPLGMAFAPLTVLAILGSLALALLATVVLVNYLAAVRANRREGKTIEIPALFSFENVSDKVLGPLVVGVAAGIGSVLCVLPGIAVLTLCYFVPHVLADRPGTPFMSAIKASFQFVKANPLPVLWLVLLLGLVASVGAFCVVGVLVSFPVAMAASWMAYDEHKASLEATAAEAGIQL